MPRAIGSTSPIWSRRARSRRRCSASTASSCSPEEAARLRKIVGHQMNLVTPGIRPAGAATGDQKRIMTPARAIAAGADYLVVGRPDHGSRRSQGGGGCHPGGDRAGVGIVKRSKKRRARWQKDTGSRASTFTMTKATRPMRRPTPPSSRNSAGASSCAAASSTAIEGQSRSRNVVIEFPDYETALACYHSPEYQANIKVRQPHSIADLVIIEGYDGPQPLRGRNPQDGRPIGCRNSPRPAIGRGEVKPWPICA